MQEELVTIKQASKILKVRPVTIRRYIKKGHLKAVTLPGGYYRLREKDIQKLVKPSHSHLIPLPKTTIFIEKLTELLLSWQTEHKLSDRQLADLLVKEDGNCVSAAMISFLRSEKRKLGIDVVRAIWTNIPDRTIHYACREWFAPPIDFNSIKELDLRDQKQLEDLRGMR